MFKILFNPQKAKRHPFETFFLGFFYSSFSILFATWVFPEYSSVGMIFLTVFACLYLIQSAIKIEEEKEAKAKEKWLLKEHSKLLSFFLFLFLGFVFSFSLWAFILPNEQVSNLFSMQDSIINSIRTIISGNFMKGSQFSSILFNNLKVLITSLIFAFFYGAAAIYVLVWNASTMGLVIGTLAKNTLGVTALPMSFLKYFIHGIPEMLAYLTVALAGGIIYVAIWKGDLLKKEKRKKIINDVLILIGISILLLIFAGLLEVYVSPFV